MTMALGGQLSLRAVVFLLGLMLAFRAVRAAIRTFVVPRGVTDPVIQGSFRALRRVFDWRTRRLATFLEQDAWLAMYGPVGLVLLVPLLVGMVLAGHMAMLWSISGAPLLDGSAWYHSFVMSGSSVLTLGFERAESPAQMLISFSAGSLGLLLIALLIAYLPTTYSAFSSRERMVTLLEVRGGNPPSAVELLQRYHRIRGLDALAELWPDWEIWFADIQESHTSLAALVFFRSPRPEQSWLTAAGAILDSAALTASTLDRPPEAGPQLCIRAGFLALGSIARYFRLPLPADPRFPKDPISIDRTEYDAACATLAAAGLPLKADRDQAWRDFAGWRVNYDSALVGLCRMTVAPPAPWTGSRGAGDRVDRVTPARAAIEIEEPRP